MEEQNRPHQQAQIRQSQVANRTRRDVQYKEGTYVLLSTPNWLYEQEQASWWQSTWAHTKCCSGLEKQSTGWSFHPRPKFIMSTVHVLLLKAYYGQPPQWPAPIWVNGSEESEVKRVIKHRMVQKKLQFLILCLGYPLADASELLNAKKVVRDCVRANGLALPVGFQDETCLPPRAVVMT